jgi:hypothetical protein
MYGKTFFQSRMMFSDVIRQQTNCRRTTSPKNVNTKYWMDMKSLVPRPLKRTILFRSNISILCSVLNRKSIGDFIVCAITPMYTSPYFSYAFARNVIQTGVDPCRGASSARVHGVSSTSLHKSSTPPPPSSTDFHHHPICLTMHFRIAISGTSTDSLRVSISWNNLIDLWAGIKSG